MNYVRRWTAVLYLLLALVLRGPTAYGQAGTGDDRVMLQGFYWESYRHGHPEKFPAFGTKVWYDIVREQATNMRNARFDLIWLPPPSFSGNYSAGYGPEQLFRLDNSYGSQAEQRALLQALLKAGIEPIADLVLNHRNGTGGWATFVGPAWGPWSICKDDEAFTNPLSGISGLPENQRGAAEELANEYASGRGHTYAYDTFRDIDHTNAQVQRDTVRYMLSLKSLGYRGWRYDMVHGFHAKHIAEYNRKTQPTFSVGEYDWGAHNEQRGWLWHTATDMPPTGTDHLKTASSVFDFTTLYALKGGIVNGRYSTLYGLGNGVGIVGDTTDSVAWKNRAVTFVENHDTGYRTDEDGNPQQDHRLDSFANNWQVEQAYAHILSHPGVPCVYWKHYFDWGADLRGKIDALINARKVAGVHAGSVVHLQENARAKGVFAAFVEGRSGALYVRIGGSDNNWQPRDSKYENYREYAAGAGWKVWVALPGNPEVRFAPLKTEFPPAPTFTAAETIVINP